MADYLTHASNAEKLLAMFNPSSFTAKNNPDLRIAMAQVEALLALAAAIANQQGGDSRPPA